VRARAIIPYLQAAMRAKPLKSRYVVDSGKVFGRPSRGPPFLFYVHFPDCPCLSLLSFRPVIRSWPLVPLPQNAVTVGMVLAEINVTNLPILPIASN